MLGCYRSSLFRGFGTYSKQLRSARSDGGCGDGHILDPVTNTYSIDTGYELLTGDVPDLYGCNAALGASPTQPVFYERGTLEWLLDRHELRTRAKSGFVQDQDPLKGADVVTTNARMFRKSLNTAGITSRERVLWFEMVDHVHAVSALDHQNDDCDDIPPPGQTPCNSNQNASKDFDTSLANKEFFEAFAGMLT